MAKRKLDIIVQAKDRSTGTFRKVGRGVERLNKSFQRVQKRLGGIGMAIGVVGMVAFARKAIAAAGEQEQAERQLAEAMKLAGDSSIYAMGGMKEYAAEIQRMTTIGDEAVMRLMALGASMGKLSGTDLKRATKAAIGLSKAFGIDTVAAMRLVARAAVGDTASLKRYGIMVDMTKGAQGRFNEVLAIGIEKFALAKSETDTMTGGIQQLKNALGDTMELIGSAGTGKGGYFSGLAEGVGAFNVALANSESPLNSFIDKTKWLYEHSPVGAGLNWLGTKIGEAATKGGADLGPSEDYKRLMAEQAARQTKAAATGQSVSQVQAAEKERAKRAKEINSLIGDERQAAWKAELEKLDAVNAKEEKRKNILSDLTQRHLKLIDAMHGADTEQQASLQGQVATVEKLIRLEEGRKQDAIKQKQQERLQAADVGTEAIRQVRVDLLRQKADEGDPAAQQRLASVRVAEQIASQQESLRDVALDTDTPDTIRRNAEALSKELSKLLPKMQAEAVAEVRKQQQADMASDVKAKAEEYQAATQGERERVRAVATLQTGTSLTGVRQSLQVRDEQRPVVDELKGLVDLQQDGNTILGELRELIARQAEALQVGVLGA